MTKTSRILTNRWSHCLIVLVVIAGVAIGWIWHEAGWYGFNLLFRGQGAYWRTVSLDSPRLSPAMRLALRGAGVGEPGEFRWQEIDLGFEVGALPVMVDGKGVDRIMLARIDPARFRFAVLNDSAGYNNLDQWMTKLGAVLVVNGSYYSRSGAPDTPFLSNGMPLGPLEYDAKGGAFVASPSSTTIHDLSHEDWKEAFEGADNAMVSYPLLLVNGAAHMAKGSQWLANRSFVGEDATGRIVIGTTEDAYFSLDRLSLFLSGAPLGLTFALNLDGGPVACQGISLHGYERRVRGQWELQVTGRKAKLLTWLYGAPAASMPVVLAVYPKADKVRRSRSD